MTLPADYHMHTFLCRHAVGAPADLAARAVELGLQEIGFSEHAPMAREDWDDWRMFQADLGRYVELVEQARRDHPRLVIRLALEVDYLPGQEDWIRDLAARAPWDYLIGAVHYLSGPWNFDNPATLAEWHRRDVSSVWSEYFDLLTRAAEAGLFDIIAHADLCKKFGFRPAQDCQPLFERFLQALKNRGLALELNTAGLRKACRELYPSPPIVQRAAQLGVPITFGSDAHAPGEVGWEFVAAVRLARSTGHTHWCRFTRRRSELVPL